MIGWLVATLGMRGILYGLGALAIVSFGGYLYVHVRNIGIAAERARIERANQEAERKADDGQSNVERCYNAGNHWNRATGVCDTGPG